MYRGADLEEFTGMPEGDLEGSQGNEAITASSSDNKRTTEMWKKIMEPLST